MLRRLALLLLPFSALALYALGCGGTKNFNFDAGSIDAGSCALPVPDGGPCDVYAQTNCTCGQKCTIEPNGGTVCGGEGTGDAYAACALDTDCKAGTACVTLTFPGFVSGLHCFPFCNLSNPGSSALCPGADAGAVCEALTLADGGLSIPEGFCDIPQ